MPGLEKGRMKRLTRFGPGTQVRQVGNVAFCCMAPEYRTCLDEAMKQWGRQNRCTGSAVPSV